jgi:hypothetical protein
MSSRYCWLIYFQGILEIFNRLSGCNYRLGIKIPISSIISATESIFLDHTDTCGKLLFTAQKIDTPGLVGSLSNDYSHAFVDRRNSFPLCRLQSHCAHCG